MPFRRPRRGFPWPGRRPGGRFPLGKPKAFWSPASWDGPAGRTLAANTLYPTIITLEASAPTATVGQAATEDYGLVRIYGMLRHRVSAYGSTGNQFGTIHAGICVLDESPAGALEASSLWPINDGTLTKRWLWQRHWNVGYVGSGGDGAGNNGPLEPGCTDTILPDGSWLDISPKGVRIRPDQRLVLIEYFELTGGALDAAMRSYMSLRPLVVMTTQRR